MVNGKRSGCHGLCRPAFTVLESIVALGILGGVLVMLGQVGYWSMRERLFGEARQTALELAANQLEAARALEWEALTPQWADAQALPEHSALSLIDGRLRVLVEMQKDSPLLKRVSVEVSWRPQAGAAEQSVRLVTLIAARANRPAGAKS
jgi:type II secretory pathway pseudopilin PulG